MPHEQFSTVQAAKLIGATYRQVNHWVKRLPTYASPGTGNHWMLSRDEVIDLGVIHTLRQLGVDLEDALRVSIGAHEHDEIRLDWGEMMLVVRVSKVRERVVSGADQLHMEPYERDRLTQDPLPFPMVATTDQA